MENQEVVTETTVLMNELKQTRKQIEENYANKSVTAELEKKMSALEKAFNRKNAEPVNRKSINSQDMDCLRFAIGKALVQAKVFDGVEGVSTNQIKNAQAYWTKAADYNSQDSGQGAEFEPSLIDPVVNKLISQFGTARQYCRVVPNIHGTLNLKKRITRATFGYTSASSDNRDDADATTTGSTYASVPLAPKQGTGLVTISEKLIFDSPINVVEEAASDLAEAAGVFEDTCLWLGDGTYVYGSYTGLLNDTDVPTAYVAAASWTNVDEVLELQSKVFPSIIGSPNARYFIHPKTFSKFQTMKQLSGTGAAGIYIFDPTTNSFKIGGYDIVFSQAMDSTLTDGHCPVVFGDLNKAVTLGQGRAASLRILTETYAQYNELGLRLTYDVGFATVTPYGTGNSAVAKLQLGTESSSS